MARPSGLRSRFDTFIKPLRGVGQGGNLVRFTFPDTDHRDYQEGESREAE
jgi:hypothetical protein